MATAMGETLHRTPRNAESFRIKRRAFRLVPPDGGLLVSINIDVRKWLYTDGLPDHAKLLVLLVEVHLLISVLFLKSSTGSLIQFDLVCFFISCMM